MSISQVVGLKWIGIRTTNWFYDIVQMLQVTVVTLFPRMVDIMREYGVSGRAINRGLVSLRTLNPRDFAQGRYCKVDDRPYGGGPGMVMMVQPLRDAIRNANQGLGGGSHVVYLTPQGRRLNQEGVTELASRERLVLVAGRYEGIDARIIERDVDEEWSVGDYVLSGGELAAMMMIDAMARTLPGCLGDRDSAREDSFWAGLLDYPHYTRPEEIDGQNVPSVLLSGDHQAISRWRRKQALGQTWLKRPDLIEKLTLDREQQALLNDFINERDGHLG